MRRARRRSAPGGARPRERGSALRRSPGAPSRALGRWSRRARSTPRALSGAPPPRSAPPRGRDGLWKVYVEYRRLDNGGRRTSATRLGSPKRKYYLRPTSLALPRFRLRPALDRPDPKAPGGTHFPSICVQPRAINPFIAVFGDDVTAGCDVVGVPPCRNPSVASANSSSSES